MPNMIALAKKYSTMLDLVYKQNSLTGVLDGADELVREGHNANEIAIPMLDMDGLGDYSRNDGYAKGEVRLVYETVKCNFDRGRKFEVDDLDNTETGGVAFGQLGGEFVRRKVIPELDAFRISKYASKDGISKDYTTEITTGKKAIEAIRTANDKMDDDEVPYEGRYLLATPSILGKITDMDTTTSRELISSFAGVIKMPKSRFHDKIKQLSGTGEYKEGGYTIPDDANLLNFMIIHPTALIQFNKLVRPKILDPDVNPDGEGWIYGYRLVSIADVYKNKLAGVYASINGSAPVTEENAGA